VACILLSAWMVESHFFIHGHDPRWNLGAVVISASERNTNASVGIPSSDTSGEKMLFIHCRFSGVTGSIFSFFVPWVVEERSLSIVTLLEAEGGRSRKRRSFCVVLVAFFWLFGSERLSRLPLASYFQYWESRNSWSTPWSFPFFLSSVVARFLVAGPNLYLTLFCC
jgi:hypothetical protein